MDIIKKINKFGIDLFDDFVMDSRKLKNGDVFLAIRGGNDFIDEALLKGAKVIYDKDIPNINNKTALKVADTVIFMQELAKKKLELVKPKVIGITGSNGKTTVKELIYLVLSLKYKVSKNEGNLNNHIGLPFSVLKIKRSDDFAVFEMGMSGLGEIDKLASMICPHIGIITNIGSAHIGLLKSKENIFKAKSEIIPHIKDKLIINGDDIYLKNLQGIKIGITSSCELFAKNIELTEKLTRFEINIDGAQVIIEMPMIGIHNVYNALFAVSIGQYYGIPIEKIQESLKQEISNKMRFEKIKVGNDIYINDAYNSSPESLIAALENFNRIYNNTYYKKIVVLGDMLELGDFEEEFHRDISTIIQNLQFDYIFLYGKRMKWLYNELKIFNIFWSNNLDEIKQKIKQIEEQKAILLKGSRGMHLEEVLYRD